MTQTHFSPENTKGVGCLRWGKLNSHIAGCGERQVKDRLDRHPLERQLAAFSGRVDLVVVDVARQAEVSDLYELVVIDQNITRCQVAMHETFPSQILLEKICTQKRFSFQFFFCSRFFLPLLSLTLFNRVSRSHSGWENYTRSAVTGHGRATILRTIPMAICFAKEYKSDSVNSPSKSRRVTSWKGKRTHSADFSVFQEQANVNGKMQQ